LKNSLNSKSPVLHPINYSSQSQRSSPQSTISLHKYSPEEKEGRKGCYECLRKGEFEFWHDTEFGMLDKDGLSKVYAHNIENPPKLSESLLIELRRTPQIITWQQELWLTHCDDFMIYKGTWKPLDFYKNSKTGDGRRLFMEMTDEDWNHIWDEAKLLKLTKPDVKVLL
jgi:uncharacterized protein CbrC (UPF0167 family)